MQIERIEVPVPFPPGRMNCYYIPDSTPTLVDTGINTPEALRSLQDGLKKFGAGLSDIRRIILTHGHSDHAGAVGVVGAASRAQVFVHSRDRHWTLAGSEEVSRENEEFFHGLFEEAGVPGQIARERTAAITSRFRKHFTSVSGMELLKGGEVFSFDRFKLKVLHTPGHTAGSICLFDEADGVLLSGDSLIEGVIPYICAELKSEADLPPYYGLEQYERSLELLDVLPVRLVLPGHGEPFTRHRELIERVRRNRSKRRKMIQDLLGAKKRQGAGEPGMTQFEVASRLFSGSSVSGAIFMVISEVRSCLEKMEQEGLVTSVIDNGKRLYRLSCEHNEKEGTR